MLDRHKRFKDNTHIKAVIIVLIVILVRKVPVKISGSTPERQTNRNGSGLSPEWGIDLLSKGWLCHLLLKNTL